MNFNIKNNSSQDLSQLTNLVREFYPYAKKHMGFNRDANIFFESDLQNAKNPLGKTAYYNPEDFSVTIYVDGRHPKDIMRSVSHELVHHHQNCEGKFENSGPTYEGYAQTDSYLREMEEDAYRRGNLIFRDWENQKNIKEIRKMKVTKKELRSYVYEAVKGFLNEKVRKDSPDRRQGDEPADRVKPLEEEVEGDPGAQAAEASAAIEKNPKMNAAIDQEVEKILADPKAAAAVLAMANKLGVSQGDDPAEIALKATQQSNMEEARKKVITLPSLGTDPEKVVAQGQSGGDAAETAGMALGLGGAIAASLAVGAVGATAGIAGLAAPAILAGGALAGHIMKRVLDAQATKAVDDRREPALYEKKNKKPDEDHDGVPDWADKKPGQDDHKKVDESDDIFAPNHYCVHHGGVHHNGSIQVAEAVNHNYNEELGRVTHYDMKLEDGTVLENVAHEDIQVTNASLAKEHMHGAMKRDDEEEEETLNEATYCEGECSHHEDKRSPEYNRCIDNCVDRQKKPYGFDASDLSRHEGQESAKDKKPLKEWYEGTLYGKLLKEYTKR